MKPFVVGEESMKKVVKKKSNVLDKPRRESASGIHFASLYQACPRRFHIKYNLGVEEAFVDKALIFGSAIHLAKEVWYQERSESKANDRGIAEIDERRDEFYDEEDYVFSRGRIKPLMNAWYPVFGYKDFEDFNILGIEEEARVEVPFTPGYVLTQRWDALLENKKTGDVYIFDTKTASSSIDLTMKSTKMSEQMTAYYFGGLEVFEERFKGLVVDVQYWSSRSKNPATIKCERSEPITRTKFEMKQFQAGIGALFNELDAKQKALKVGTPSPFLYRKNTFYCMAYFRRCPYADICGIADKDIPSHLPEGLVQRSTENNKLDGLTWDGIYMGEGPS